MSDSLHKDFNCPKVLRRVACKQCNYPASEADFPNVVSYMKSLTNEPTTSYTVEGFYKDHLRWGVWVKDLPLEVAKDLLKRGNSLTLELRIVEVVKTPLK